jgi:hypothetical protein
MKTNNQNNQERKQENIRKSEQREQNKIPFSERNASQL